MKDQDLRRLQKSSDLMHFFQAYMYSVSIDWSVGSQ